MNTTIIPYNPYISHVHNLPPEIMSEIFLYACAPVKNRKWCAREYHPFWLGAVCGLWRKIARTTARLWTTVSIRAIAHSSERPPYQDQAELLRQWLENSRSCNLDIFIGPSKKNTLSYEVPTLLMKLLYEHQNRWNTFEIELAIGWNDIFLSDDIMDLNGQRTPMMISAPNLQSISFQHTWQFTCGFSVPNLSNAPLLKQVGISYLIMPLAAVKSLIPSGSITHLTLKGMAAINLTVVCEELPRLQSLDISNSVTVVSNYSTRNRHLSSITFYHSFPVANVFKLTLPALKKLSFSVNEPISPAMLITFVERSGCLLTNLTMNYVRVEHRLLDILRALPPLKELDITMNSASPRNCGLPVCYLRIFSPRSGMLAYLPNLEAFSYTGPLLGRVGLDILVPLVIRMRPMGPERGPNNDAEAVQLQRVTIKSNQHLSSISEQICAGCQTLARCETRVQYPGPPCRSTLAHLIKVGSLTLINFDETPWLLDGFS